MIRFKSILLVTYTWKWPLYQQIKLHEHLLWLSSTPLEHCGVLHQGFYPTGQSCRERRSESRDRLCALTLECTQNQTGRWNHNKLLNSRPVLQMLAWYDWEDNSSEPCILKVSSPLNLASKLKSIFLLCYGDYELCLCEGRLPVLLFICSLQNAAMYLLFQGDYVCSFFRETARNALYGKKDLDWATIRCKQHSQKIRPREA